METKNNPLDSASTYTTQNESLLREDISSNVCTILNNSLDPENTVEKKIIYVRHGTTSKKNDQNTLEAQLDSAHLSED